MSQGIMMLKVRKIRADERFEHIGMVARWRPVHRGHAPVLRALCDRASTALIGIGSANRYDFRNPFTLQETIDMIQLVLADRKNYELLPVPDLDDGPRWRTMILDMFGSLDLFVTDNPYVSNLLATKYRTVRPVELIAEHEKILLDGTMVRREMARGGRWRDMLPEAVAEYITTNQLDERFRQEFGLQTLALDTIIGNRRDP